LCVGQRIKWRKRKIITNWGSPEVKSVQIRGGRGRVEDHGLGESLSWRGGTERKALLFKQSKGRIRRNSRLFPRQGKDKLLGGRTKLCTGEKMGGIWQRGMQIKKFFKGGGGKGFEKPHRGGVLGQLTGIQICWGGQHIATAG